MKNAILFLFLTTSTFAFSQLPKGNRIFAWSVDQAENESYDTAFAYAHNACMESIHMFRIWSSIEPDAGNFDSAYLAYAIDPANAYYAYMGVSVELQLAITNTVSKEVPADLQNVAYDDPQMINRFKTFLDTIFAHIPDLQLDALNIGNESDILFGTDSVKYAQFKGFLNAVVPYAKQLYFNLHGTTLKVGTTLTMYGTFDPNKTALCHMLNESLDIASITYYPLAPDFTMKPPSIVTPDFANLVSIYPDTSQPIYIVECGYASSSVCNSSETLQSQFYENVFAAWDTHADNIKFLSIFQSTDWSQDVVDTLGAYYGITSPVFLEYLRTLGVRTWPNGGTEKLAYQTILCELNTRNWCNVSCTSTGMEPIQKTRNIGVYPNPTTGMTMIEADEVIKYITIIGSIGQSMCNAKTEIGNSQTMIDLTDYPAGVYYLKLEFEDERTVTKRVVKE
jgi:hypothetical protein